MDATTRWETEAIRSGTQSRKTPPHPTSKQQEREGHWVTLKEAEAATSIPTNTLRKWVRKSAIPSYLESDGDVSLRMVDLDAAIAHANDLGRHVEPLPEPEPEADEGEPASVANADHEESPPQAVTDGTMIVPIDAWNKMLNQLGNLHEAGQQLAEARERAAKAETEATFLRERLSELRSEPSEEADPAADSAGVSDDLEADGSPAPTTSYWRYLTLGWRDRRKRS